MKSSSVPSWGLWLGLVFTALWCGLWINYGFRQDLPNLELNEIGDFLTGVFAPLALGWFVVGVYLQKQELRNNLQEIKNQTSALQGQVEATSNALQYEMSEARKRQFREWQARQPLLVGDWATSRTGNSLQVHVKVYRKSLSDVYVFTRFEADPRVFPLLEVGNGFAVTIPEPFDEHLPTEWRVYYRDEVGDWNLRLQSITSQKEFQDDFPMDGPLDGIPKEVWPHWKAK